MGIRIKIQDGLILAQDASKEQFAQLSSSGKFRWGTHKWKDKATDQVRSEQALIATANLDALDRLEWTLRQSGLRLPRDAERLSKELHAVRDAVDRERVRPDPKPLVKYPVKMSLYAHQTRAANMCLLTFGWVAPEAEGKT